MKLVREGIARSTDALPQRIAALDHEAVDHPVEDYAIIVGLLDATVAPRVRPFLGAFGQLDEVRHGLRHLFVEQANGEAPLSGCEYGIYRQGRLLAASLRI